MEEEEVGEEGEEGGGALVEQGVEHCSGCVQTAPVGGGRRRWWQTALWRGELLLGRWESEGEEVDEELLMGRGGGAAHGLGERSCSICGLAAPGGGRGR